MWRTTHLDTSQTQKPALLLLEPLINLVGVVSVDVRFLHQRECDAMVECAEFADGSVVPGFLSAELEREDCDLR